MHVRMFLKFFKKVPESLAEEGEFFKSYFFFSWWSMRLIKLIRSIFALRVRAIPLPSKPQSLPLCRHQVIPLSKSLQLNQIPLFSWVMKGPGYMLHCTDTVNWIRRKKVPLFQSNTSERTFGLTGMLLLLTACKPDQFARESRHNGSIPRKFHGGIARID